MDRYLKDKILKNIGQKIILISGPRQVGKTTLAKELTSNFSYYNYDVQKNSQVFLRQEWNRETDIVIFDELQKKKKWKLWLKGLYDDGAFHNQTAIVTGSARLSHLKKVGDSLAGRFLEYRLHPLDLKELKMTGTVTGSGTAPALENYQKLIERGGFPEPFLSLDLDQSRVWRRSHTDTILRQDLLSLEVVRDLDSIEVLMELLSTRVGSIISYNSLAEDLKVRDVTIKRWLGLLEDLFVVFRLNATAKNITRGLNKAGKYYFYDLARVQADESAILENAVALALRKELDFIEDTKGLRTSLNFIRDKEKREIDFYVRIEKQTAKLIEVKLSDSSVSPSFNSLGAQLPLAEKIQLVLNLDQRFDSREGVKVEPAANYLEDLNLLASNLKI